MSQSEGLKLTCLQDLNPFYFICFLPPGAETHVVRHLHHGQDEEDVLLAVLQLLVLELSVHLAVPQRELLGQASEVGGDVSSGLGLPAEAQLSARSVYLAQQLRRSSEKETVDNSPAHGNTSNQISSSRFSFFLSFFFVIAVKRADCEKQKITEKING